MQLYFHTNGIRVLGEAIYEVPGYVLAEVAEGCDRSLPKAVENGVCRNATPEEIAAWALADRKAERNRQIDKRTQAIIADGFTFGGFPFSLSHNAQTNWLTLWAAREVLSYPFEVSRIDDGSYEIANSEAMNSFGMLALSTVSVAMAGGRSLKQAVLAATTLEEVDAVVDDR